MTPNPFLCNCLPLCDASSKFPIGAYYIFPFLRHVCLYLPPILACLAPPGPSGQTLTHAPLIACPLLASMYPGTLLRLYSVFFPPF